MRDTARRPRRARPSRTRSRLIRIRQGRRAAAGARALSGPFFERRGREGRGADPGASREFVVAAEGDRSGLQAAVTRAEWPSEARTIEA